MEFEVWCQIFGVVGVVWFEGGGLVCGIVQQEGYWFVVFQFGDWVVVGVYFVLQYWLVCVVFFGGVVFEDWFLGDYEVYWCVIYQLEVF